MPRRSWRRGQNRGMTKATSSEYRNLRNALALIACLLAAVVVFGYLTYTGDRDSEKEQGARDAYTQCLTSNDSRAAIKTTFKDLFDGVVQATPAPRQAATKAFFDARLAVLNESLPQRVCVKP